MVQREPILEASTAGPTAPGQTPPLTAEQLRAINVEAAAELRRLAGNAIGSAVEQFHRGCDSVKSDLEKEAKAQLELVSLVADVVGGFAVPALVGKLVAETALRKTLSDASRRAITNPNDLGPLMDEMTAIHGLTMRGASLNPKFYDRISGDNIKATFTGALRSATVHMKSVGPGMLTGNTQTVISELSMLATSGRQDLDRSLPTKSESELLAIIVALDASKANEAIYAKTIKRYLNEVLEIGGHRSNQFGGGQTRLVKINAYGGWRLAVVESGVSGIVVGTPFHDFRAWVSPGMQSSALARAGLPVDQAPLEVVLGQVPTLKADLLSSIPAPSTEDSVLLP